MRDIRISGRANQAGITCRQGRALSLGSSTCTLRAGSHRLPPAPAPGYLLIQEGECCQPLFLPRLRRSNEFSLPHQIYLHATTCFPAGPCLTPCPFLAYSSFKSARCLEPGALLASMSRWALSCATLGGTTLDLVPWLQGSFVLASTCAGRAIRCNMQRLAPSRGSSEAHTHCRTLERQAPWLTAGHQPRRQQKPTLLVPRQLRCSASP
jgi:hypothetical protein